MHRAAIAPVVTTAVCAAVFAALAFVQLASYAVYSPVSQPGAIPSHLSPALGERMYRVLARLAPAPYVLQTLAQSAYQRGDLRAANTYVQRLHDGPLRSEWLGHIALAKGDRAGALREFIAASDAESAQQQIDAGAAGGLGATIAAQRALTGKLQRERDHPDALAEATWNLGRYLDRAGDRAGALAAYQQAATLSPIAAKYLISAAFEERAAGDLNAAQRYFEHAVDADPSSADAIAGEGLLALDRGDRAAALRYERRAAALNGRSGALAALRSRLR